MVTTQNPEFKYDTIVNYLKTSGLDLEAGTDYVVRNFLGRNNNDPLGAMLVIIRAYKIKLHEAKEIVETKCHQIKLELGLYTENELKQFAETQAIIDSLNLKTRILK